MLILSLFDNKDQEAEDHEDQIKIKDKVEEVEMEVEEEPLLPLMRNRRGKTRSRWTIFEP